MQVLIINKDGIKNINLNRRKTIHERCLDCSAWIPKEVTDCTLTQCSLHPYRLGKGKQDAAERQKAIRAYCLLCMNGQIGEVTKCPSINCSLFAYRKGGLERAITSPSFEKIGNTEGSFSINVGAMNRAKGENQSCIKTMPI